jgi:hypothetical protein
MWLVRKEGRQEGRQADKRKVNGYRKMCTKGLAEWLKQEDVHRFYTDIMPFSEFFFFFGVTGV